MREIEVRSLTKAYVFLGEIYIEPFSIKLIEVSTESLDDINDLIRLYNIGKIYFSDEVYSYLKGLLINSENIGGGIDLSLLNYKEDKYNKTNTVGSGSSTLYPSTKAVKSYVESVSKEIDNKISLKENKLKAIKENNVVKELGVPLYTLGVDGTYILCDPDMWFEIEAGYVIPAYLKSKLGN